MPTVKFLNQKGKYHDDNSLLNCAPFVRQYNILSNKWGAVQWSSSVFLFYDWKGGSIGEHYFGRTMYPANPGKFPNLWNKYRTTDRE